MFPLNNVILPYLIFIRAQNCPRQPWQFLNDKFCSSYFFKFSHNDPRHEIKDGICNGDPNPHPAVSELGAKKG